MKKLEIPDFGIQWPDGVTLLQRHNYCAYWDKGLGSFYHRKAIIQAIWPEEIFAWHHWSDRMLQSTCDYKPVVWLGAGGTSKSTTAAALGLQWWWEAPFESCIRVCSTTKQMLRERVWSEFSRLFFAVPKFIEFRTDEGELIQRCPVGYLGELIDTELKLRWRQGDSKHAISGFGVNEGSVAEAVSNIIGVHTRKMWLMLDELQGIREAVDNAKDNMSKNPVFRVLGMGNTDENMKSLLRRAATPVNGWDSVDTSTAESWETDGGVVAPKGIALRFDGRKSPAVDNPKKYPFLINQAQIDAHLRKAGDNENDPGFLSQCRAIWPTTGLQNTVLDATIIAKFRCHERATWTNGFQKGFCLDPSFTEGGDKRSLHAFKFGLINDNEGERWVIEFGECVNVPVDSSSEIPIHYQIVYFCRDWCINRGGTNDDFALDSSGEGGGLKAIFDIEWGVVTGIEFGGNPSDTPYDDRRTAKDVFDRRVSEINLNLRSFVLGNGLRGISKEVADQACTRRTIYKNKKQTVEKKKEMKTRTGGQSPDDLDSCCVGVAFAMQNGARPGGGIVQSRRTQNIMAQLAYEGAAMISEEGMLEFQP